MGVLTLGNGCNNTVLDLAEGSDDASVSSFSMTLYDAGVAAGEIVNDGGSRVVESAGRVPCGNSCPDESAVPDIDAAERPTQIVSPDAAVPEVAASSTLTVFATSEVYAGDLGGLAGGDAICTRHANSAGLRGDYMAWLSGGGLSMRERFPESDMPITLVSGELVASGLDDLLDGDLLAPIDLDEFGVAVGGGVWTGTTSNGERYVPANCDGFTIGTEDDIAACGTTTDADWRWTYHSVVSCDLELRLYCFESL